MHWNYRVVKSRELYGDEVRESFGLHEVYYNEAGEQVAHSVVPTQVSEETLEGLLWFRDRLSEALEKPVLEFADEPRLRESDTCAGDANKPAQSLTGEMRCR